MKHVKPTPGRISVHGNEAGEISTPELEERAREIALLDGRDEPTVADRRAALRELQGLAPLDADTTDASDPRPAATRDPSEPASFSGERVPETPPSDPEELPAQLVEEGVEEAQHDQMIAARRRRER